MRTNTMQRVHNLHSTSRALFAALALLGAVSAFAQNPSSGTAPAASVNPYIQQAPPAGTLVAPGASLPIDQNPSGVGTQSGSSIFYPDIKVYVLNPGDLINVRLYGVPEFSTTLRLSKDGTGELPLIGSLNLAGMTIERAQNFIADRLKTAGMYRNPGITITLGEMSQDDTAVNLAGEMHGRVPLRGGRTLADVLYSAGGLPVGASPVVSIIRPGVDEPIIVNLGTTAKELAKANIPIQPRDTIFVQRAGAVYVLGAFRQTGIFPMQNGRTTLLQIASLSGGPTYAGKFADTRIIRTVGDQRTEVKVDMKKILYGQDPDPILQAGDIIFLPPSTLKTILSSGGLSTLLSVVNLALLVTRN